MSLSISFQLGVVEEGLELDGVTPARKTVLYCSPDTEEVRAVLEREKIPVKVGDGLRVMIPMAEMLTCKGLFEGAGHVVQEYVPYTIWKFICDRQARPSLDEATVRTGIGDELWDRLHPYQRVGVRRMVEQQKQYLGDEMGTGKTLQSLAAAWYYRDRWPALIVCPKSLTYTWKSEAVRWLGVEEASVVVVRKSNDLSKLKPHRLLIVPYSLVGRPGVIQSLSAKRYDVAILDEAHYMQGLSSKRSHGAVAITRHSSVKWLLSGTPFNYPSQLFMQLKALDPELYLYFFHYTDRPSKEQGKVYFAERYCQPTKVRFRRTTAWQFHGYERSEELGAVLNVAMLRRRKRDVLSQLPAKTRICISLPPMSAKDQRAMDKLLKGEKKKPPKKRQATTPEAKETEENNLYMEAFRLSARVKLPAVLRFIEEHLVGDLMSVDPSLKVLVFFHHQVVREALVECLDRLGVSHFVIDGSTGSQQRQEYVNDFQQTQKYRIALLSITACGVGLTLTAATCCVFTEVLFGPEHHLQAEDRAHRIGLRSELTIFYLLLGKSTDDKNFGLIRKKDRESSTILEGSQQTSSIQSQRLGMPDSDTSLTEMLASRKRKQPDDSIPDSAAALPQFRRHPTVSYSSQ